MVVEPTGTPISWPAATLEGRLILGSTGPLSDVIADWLIRPSSQPVVRGLMQGEVMLMVSGRLRPDYCVPDAVFAAMSRDEIAADAPCTDCRRDRPELWTAIVASVNQAVRQLKIRARVDTRNVLWASGGCAAANPAKTAAFGILQRLCRVNLLGLVDATHMWNAAIESKGCRLTPLGEHYRRLAAAKRI